MSRATPEQTTAIPELATAASSGAGYLLGVLQRRWLTVIVIATIIATGSFAYSKSQHPTYAASADVLLLHQNLAASLNNVPDPGTASSDLNRAAQTQASIATSPSVIKIALQAAGLPQDQAGALARNSSVTAAPTADILTFAVQNKSAAMAVRLASEYARAYTSYRRTLDSAGVNLALTGIKQRLAQLRSEPHPSVSLVTSLSDDEDRLNTLAAFQASNASVVRFPTAAAKVSPRPTRALLVGLLLGAILGLGFAMLRDGVDTRVQDADEVVQGLGMPLLAGIPALPKKQRQAHELVMLADPGGSGSEAFRTLRTSVDFATVDDAKKVIMVSSAVQAEGKSTTAANLAVAFARSGRRVVLVDLDLRRPYVARFFDAAGKPGLTDVALGTATLTEALTDVDIDLPSPSSNGHVASLTLGNESALPAITSLTAHSTRRRGSLRILTSGLVPPDTGEFVASDRVRLILAGVEAEADVVLVDAPPLLTVSDGLALSARVSAILFVARLGLVRRPMFKEVRRVLAQCPARVIGCVVTGIQPSVSYGYGYGYGYRTPLDRSDSEPPHAVAGRAAEPQVPAE